jgi:CDP-glycerol glycerophosphotransferase (TagB/SpsB family)
MKSLTKNSPYTFGREGAPDYIIVSSEKEKDVTADMMKIDESRILNTGLGALSTVGYKHINQDSENYVTIMLTWKAYEENIYNFEETTYYQNTVQVYNMLKKFVNPENIIVLAHPKVNELIHHTDLKNSLWDKSIAMALEKTKLLITDYSSVCYNAYYQGAGVVFYQPDLELYELDNGKLIPNDNEYIGERTYTPEELETVLENVITNNEIQLDKLRNQHTDEVYKTINEFSDGKNIDRICQKLIELNFV